MSQRLCIANVKTGWLRHSKWKWSYVVMHLLSWQHTFSTGISICLHLPHLHQSGVSSSGKRSGSCEESDTRLFSRLIPPRAPARRHTAFCRFSRDISSTYSYQHNIVFNSYMHMYHIHYSTSSFVTSSSLLMWLPPPLVSWVVADGRSCVCTRSCICVGLSTSRLVMYIINMYNV